MKHIYLICGGPCSGKSSLVKELNSVHSGIAFDLEEVESNSERLEKLGHMVNSCYAAFFIALADVTPSQLYSLNLKGVCLHFICLYASDSLLLRRKLWRIDDHQELWSFCGHTKLRYEPPSDFFRDNDYCLVNTTFTRNFFFARQLISNVGNRVSGFGSENYVIGSSRNSPQVIRKICTIIFAKTMIRPFISVSLLRGMTIHESLGVPGTGNIFLRPGRKPPKPTDSVFVLPVFGDDTQMEIETAMLSHAAVSTDYCGVGKRLVRSKYFN